MNREQAKQLLPIIQAFADGADVQYLSETGKWTDIPPWSCLVFNNPTKYRIKPKLREWWDVLDRHGNIMLRRETKERAQNAAIGIYEIVHVREVTE